MIDIGGINFNDLNKLAKAEPKYATLLGQLAGIDKLVKNFATNVITNYGDASVYYIKTELLNQCYNFYLYNKERNAIIGHSWLFDDFLQKCQTKEIENELNSVILKMIDKFNSNDHLSDKKIQWL